MKELRSSMLISLFLGISTASFSPSGKDLLSGAEEREGGDN
jgi:hypothetical protein